MHFKANFDMSWELLFSMTEYLSQRCLLFSLQENNAMFDAS